MTRNRTKVDDAILGLLELLALRREVPVAGCGVLVDRLFPAAARSGAGIQIEPKSGQGYAHRKCCYGGSAWQF